MLLSRAIVFGSCQKGVAAGRGLEWVRTVVTELSQDANPELVAARTDRVTLRVLTGGGTRHMNPVVVTVEVARRERTTVLHVRAVAKEGLVKQLAGGKTRL